MTRRQWLQGLFIAAAGGAIARVATSGSAPSPSPAPAATGGSIEAMQKNWRGFLPASFNPPAPVDKVKLTADQWRKRLDKAQFDVLREEGTERAGTSPLNAEKRAGVYACAGCDLPLFTSEMKYESGTGWPSFFTTIPAVFETKKDFGLFMPRVEYHCTRCGGHHGHVFEDGPKPTGLRYCNNGVALKFIPRNLGA